MDFRPDEQDRQLRQRLDSWNRRNPFDVEPAQGDLEQAACRLARQLGQDGFMAYAVPTPYGGARATVQTRDLCVIREELASHSALADVMFGVQALGSQPIVLAGTAEQKQKYLPPLAAAENIAAFALTEPEAGSDAAAISTRGTRVSGGYRLDGSKCFISNAGIADTYVVFASTEPSAKAKGISAFIVTADSPGFALKEKTPLLSPHPIGTLSFDNCFVPQEQLLGAVGDGLSIAFRTLDTLRCTVGAAAVGFAGRALAEAISYSQSRRQFGHAIGEFQGIQFKLADMAAELEAARLLVYQAAWSHDMGEPELRLKSSMAKLFATEAAQRIVDQALQIHGGKGVVAGHITERLYRDVRALRIYEGSSEIQKLVIARSLMRKEPTYGL
ncbi:MAG TPA: acyl-CoA dehydrogenase family protein [Terriglobales bacterium]|jgi:acyl-CoA dehydrogenase|nr:acyl-CoA dehydrogenase family protein [Terriglobales bacterium]